MRKRRRKNNKILFLWILLAIIMIVITISIVRSTLARYSSTASSTANIELAYYLLGEESISQDLKLASILPQASPYVHEFSVANYKDGDRTQTALEYTIKIKMTTNLHLDVSVNKKNQSTNLVTSTRTEQDADGTFFKYITVQGDEFGYSTNQQNIYELKITFPTIYNSADYEGIIEYLQLTIESKQKISST